ncbi:hypothetical protein GGX14DRAFT_650978 [Mycena pura]|uniref:Uncharacterized protein n=1 Tax=Mycena pura TaxID=153505 RepID=A0AAD6YNG8_9AGAR|nr:hypothetical protein GGX14DRAFT_650978 [Mycena pura]
MRGHTLSRQSSISRIAIAANSLSYVSSSELLGLGVVAAPPLRPAHSGRMPARARASRRHHYIFAKKRRGHRHRPPRVWGAALPSGGAVEELVAPVIALDYLTHMVPDWQHVRTHLPPWAAQWVQLALAVSLLGTWTCVSARTPDVRVARRRSVWVRAARYPGGAAKVSGRCGGDAGRVEAEHHQRRGCAGGNLEGAADSDEARAVTGDVSDVRSGCERGKRRCQKKRAGDIGERSWAEDQSQDPDAGGTAINRAWCVQRATSRAAELRRAQGRVQLRRVKRAVDGVLPADFTRLLFKAAQLFTSCFQPACRGWKQVWRAAGKCNKSAAEAEEAEAKLRQQTLDIESGLPNATLCARPRQCLNETVDQFDTLRKKHAELEVLFDTTSRKLMSANASNCCSTSLTTTPCRGAERRQSPSRAPTLHPADAPRCARVDLRSALTAEVRCRVPTRSGVPQARAHAPPTKPLKRSICVHRVTRAK